MTQGRALRLLCGVALLASIAKFNEMTPAAQAAFLNGAAGTAQSLIDNAVATYQGIPNPAPERAAPRPRPAVVADAATPAPAPRPSSAKAPDAAADAPSGNPLWALPFKQLSNTRERPIFSPSRRPPPPPPSLPTVTVAIQQPVKPPEPERPRVSLLGTVVGNNPEDRLAVFLETTTQTVVRVHVGDDHEGWVLRLVKPREVTLVKGDNDAVVLELPGPGEPPPAGFAAFGAAAAPAAMPQPPQQPQQRPQPQPRTRRSPTPTR